MARLLDLPTSRDQANIREIALMLDLPHRIFTQRVLFWGAKPGPFIRPLYVNNAIPPESCR